MSTFYNSTTNDIKERLVCEICDTKIYPGRWTDAIERMYSYHLKTIEPEQSIFRPTILLVILLAALLIIIGGVLYYGV